MYPTGLIQNDDDDVVSQLEDMVKQSISLPSTIILVTVPAEGAFLSPDSPAPTAPGIPSLTLSQTTWTTRKP